MIREWRNLKMLKRAGRGYDPAGVMATREGGAPYFILRVLSAI
jgi:hypothetical protein